MKKNFEGLGFEAIEYQRDGKLHDIVTSAIDRLRGIHSTAVIDQIFEQMSRQIAIRTGLFVIFQLTDKKSPAVSVTPLVKTHPFIYKTQQAMLAKEGSNVYRPISIESMFNGRVDLKTSKVSGDFSTIPNVVLIPKTFLSEQLLTTGEVSATVLHELGHIFGYYELMGHNCVTNVLLNELARVWAGNYPTEKRVQVLDMIENSSTVKFSDKEKLASNDDPKVAAAVIVNGAINAVRSELNTPWYDERVFEFMADQFAVRHGAGRDLITGFDKLMRAKFWLFREAAFRSTTSMLAYNIVNAAMLVSGNGLANMGVRVLKGTPIISKVALTGLELAVEGVTDLGLTFGLSLFSKESKRYDSSLDRINATRREMLNDLKDRTLDKEYVKQALENLDTVETILKNMNSLGKIDTMLYQFIVDKATGKHNELKLQQDYEKLANNDLFHKAAKLSTLGH